jgi:hypothetical protein
VDGQESSKAIAAATKQIAKKKGKKVYMKAEVLKETPTIRVTQSQVKHLKLDSGDQVNTKTLASSSLIELSTFQVRDMWVLATRKSLASSTIIGRVTRSKTQRLLQPVTHSPPAYINLGVEDTPPPTPLAGVGSNSDWETPEDRMVQGTVGPSVGIKHVSPSTRGKGKLNTSSDQRVIQLEEKL